MSVRNRETSLLTFPLLGRRYIITAPIDFPGFFFRILDATKPESSYKGEELSRKKMAKSLFVILKKFKRIEKFSSFSFRYS